MNIVTKMRLQLLENGYSPIRNRDKRTFMPGWPTAEITPEEIDRWGRRFKRDTATGMRIENGLAAIDFDINDKTAMDLIADRVFDAIPQLGDVNAALCVRRGKGAKEAWFVRTDEEFGRIHSRSYTRPGESVDDGTHRIEVFGGASARQFGAFGPHTVEDDGTVTVSYAWPERSPLDTPQRQLPELTKAQFFQIADIVEAALQELGWTQVERSQAGENGASDSVYDLTEDMVFMRTLDGEQVTLAELEDMARHGMLGEGSPRYELSPVPWLRPQSNSGGGCLAGATHDGTLFIHDCDTSVNHYPVTEATRDLSEGIRARLAELKLPGLSNGGDDEEAGEATGPEAEREAYRKLIDAEVDKLSWLSAGEYAAARTPASRRLQLNLKTLDSMVRIVRKKRAENAARDDAAKHGRALTCDDFVAFMPTHQYIHRPTGALWPASSVNARVPPVEIEGADALPASEWLDRYAPVDQMTWAPGEPEIIRNEVIDEGGRRYNKGGAAFNLYRPPVCPSLPGDASPWCDHVHFVYPHDADHIIKWMAQRAQRPEEKLNHALVLGGKPGIGKDTIIEPVRQAIGPWNVADIAPDTLLGRFTPHARSTIMVVSEAHDLGDANRFTFYERMKRYVVSPPDVLQVDEKHLRPYSVPNVCGVIITSNHRTDGLFLPADDRRHYVAWSPLRESPKPPEYFDKLYRWYTQERGYEIVAHYLRTLDISDFNPKKPPPKTDAFWEIVHASSNPEDAELAEAIATLDDQGAVTLTDLMQHRVGRQLGEPAARRKVPHRMGAAGYVPVRNPARQDGLWTIAGKRQAIYGREADTPAARLRAAQDREQSKASGT